ncbi:phosphatidylserine/phosphatidylglycerophosphate/cardiolipin synthase family protein [Prosthecobacter sp.]|uniref:phosphatidylserine/phosphatidylglycerophosphate/ cardiolipin synthase family protein n=1 Tax=Prosthecobacter sp. TaxID=1965333 RepID=UPI00378325CA
MKSWPRLAAYGILSLQLTSCGSTRPNSSALPTVGFVSQETIAHACRQHTVRRQGTSGFEMLPDGREAFLARLAMVEAAQRTLDLQYYIWSDDVVGTTFADRLLAAADRGVKVRLLLDNTMDAQVEVSSAALAAHPNIEVAFFNPMTDLKGIFAGNPIPVIGEIDRMQSRMHNKIMIADGTLLMGGGRNLGDPYFGIHRHHNMRDLDFIASGPVVEAAAKSFELYWRSPLTRPGNKEKITNRERKGLQDLRKHVARKKRGLAVKNGKPYPLTLSRAESLDTLHQLVSRMIWAEYEFVADPPERMMRLWNVASPVWHNIEAAVRKSRHGVLMHAAYFIPQSDTLNLLRAATARGVKVQVLTNSLASTDGVAAMAGIANRRVAALDTGVSFYELNAYAADRKEYIHARRLTPLGMHTKGFVIDNDVSFIGSYNMDPRSKYINTETGVIIHSMAFAARLKSHLMKGLQPQNSWHVTRAPNGSILWTGQLPNGQPAVRRLEPGASLMRRLEFWFYRCLPWEDLL